MEVITTRTSMRQRLSEHSHRASAQIAFIPTMGALHAGHVSLIHHARKTVGSDGIVVVSIFVNPTQFNNKEDLKHYPKTEQSDHQLCEKNSVDFIYRPSGSEIYASDASVSVSESSLSQTLCGATRPGHFDGVCTIVLKLYNTIQPNFMVFGEKDFQQLAIINRMVRDLDLPVTIIPGSTVRESDGLALSSRNTRLSPRARGEAARLHQFLQNAKHSLTKNLVSPAKLESQLEQELALLTTKTRIDYLTLVDQKTLETISTIERPAVLALAVFFDEVRLIDHITIDLTNEGAEV